MAAVLQQSPAALQGRTPAARGPSAPISAAVRSLPLRSSSSSIAALPGALRLSRRSATVPVRRRRLCVTMMNTSAGSYAEALADVAISNGTLEATVADIEKVEMIFSDEGAHRYFANPAVEPEKKRELMAEIALSLSLQPHTANFLNILVDVDRTELLQEIAKEFESYYNRITETEVAVVSSVVPLESQHLTQIAKWVQRRTEAKNVRIKTKLDPSLVAGFTVSYGLSGSMFIDMSVKKQLDGMSRELELEEIPFIS